MNETGVFPQALLDAYEGLEIHEVEKVRGYGIELDEGFLGEPDYVVFTKKSHLPQCERD
jgi:hypothetical protein